MCTYLSLLPHTWTITGQAAKCITPGGKKHINQPCSFPVFSIFCRKLMFGQRMCTEDLTFWWTASSSALLHALIPIAEPMISSPPAAAGPVTCAPFDFHLMNLIISTGCSRCAGRASSPALEITEGWLLHGLVMVVANKTCASFPMQNCLGSDPHCKFLLHYIQEHLSTFYFLCRETLRVNKSPLSPFLFLHFWSAIQTELFKSPMMSYFLEVSNHTCSLFLVFPDFSPSPWTRDAATPELPMQALWQDGNSTHLFVDHFWL